MNLFRSEEHVRNWSGFKAGTEEGINKLADVARLFSINFFTRRLDPNYASHMLEYMMELVGAVKGMGSFWQPPEL
jgi:hypothetical protein